MTARILREQGYTVLEAANGQEALNFVHGKGIETIHLLLTDVVMPHMGGKGLLEKVKTRLPNIKVLFISGHTDSVINHHGFFEPYAALLQKPFSANLLARKVRELLAQ